jgi:hypothetical protein
LGLFDQARLCAERVAHISRARRRTLVLVCPDGYNMFKKRLSHAST